MLANCYFIILTEIWNRLIRVSHEFLDANESVVKPDKDY
jgi:hypothetical protein